MLRKYINTIGGGDPLLMKLEIARIGDIKVLCRDEEDVSTSIGLDFGGIIEP